MIQDSKISYLGAIVEDSSKMPKYLINKISSLLRAPADAIFSSSFYMAILSFLLLAFPQCFIGQSVIFYKPC